MIEPLIEELTQTRRDITDAELRGLRQSVADAGFDPNARTRAGVDVAGLVWQARTLASNDSVSNDVRHYLRHVVVQQEWPSSTSLPDYVQSLRDVVLDDDGSVLFEQIGAVRRLTFLGHSGIWRGPSGGAWILVGYTLGYGHWVTGYQPNEQELLKIRQMKGPGRRWLQR